MPSRKRNHYNQHRVRDALGHLVRSATARARMSSWMERVHRGWRYPRQRSYRASPLCRNRPPKRLVLMGAQRGRLMAWILHRSVRLECLIPPSSGRGLRLSPHPFRPSLLRSRMVNPTPSSLVIKRRGRIRLRGAPVEVAVERGLRGNCRRCFHRRVVHHRYLHHHPRRLRM